MTSVCIATAFPVFRDGLRRALGEQGFRIAATPNDTASVVCACRAEHPDVIVLDTLLPGESAVALLRRLRQLGCAAAMILFGNWTPESADVACRLTACSMLSAFDDTQTFVRAVGSVAAGDVFVSALVREQLRRFDAHVEPVRQRIERLLTPTERQILRALAGNRTSKEIAGEMYISFRTVQKHRSNIARKLHIDGSNALLTLAVRHFNELR
jgi:two-component system nitrate/nitrite response regulator NarL